MYGHLTLALGYLWQWYFQQGADAQMLARAVAAAQRAIALNDSSPWGLLFLGYVYLFQKQYEQAVAEMERAIALDPNEAISYALLAQVLSCVGRSEEAMGMVEQALRRKSRTAPDQHLYIVGAAYGLARRPEAAIAPLKQYLIPATPIFLALI